MPRTVLLNIHQPQYRLWHLPPELPVLLRQRFEARGVQFLSSPTDAPFEQALADAEVLIGRGLNAENFGTAKKLRWLQSHMAGVGSLLFPALVDSDVVLTNARGVHAPPMAEHLIGLMLSLVRKLHRARDFQHEGRWGQEELWREEPLSDEIGGRTLGIVGLGAIGMETARRARAMGMRTIAIRRRPDQGDGDCVDEVRGVDEMPWLLEQSDFVANCLPHTSRTEKLFDAAAFSYIRRHAYFLNVGRGDTVDEEALIAALRSGALAGAGIDVTAEEPLPPGHPFYSLPNVVLTPHVSGASARFWERMSVLIENNLGRYLDGEPLLNVIDKREGY